MVKYELQKLFSRPLGKGALVVLAAVVALTTFFACSVRWTDQEGQNHTGPAAARQLRQQQKAWAGVLDETMLRQAIQANWDVSHSADARSEDITWQNMAYHQSQAFGVIRDLLNQSYSSDFQSYDYYNADTVTPDEAPAFYDNRLQLLQKWMAEEDVTFTPEEEAYLVEQYQALETPFSVDYITGWQQFYDYSPTIIMLSALLASFLVAGIFAQESQWKADAIFFSTRHGRGKGTAAKVRTGVLLLTGLYWVPFLAFAGLTLGLLGADGASCPVQVIAWKSFYNITVGQGALLIALGGYLGTLVLGLLTMWMSAKTGSAMLSAVLPFAIIFVPALLLRNTNTLLSDILGLLPDKLLQLNRDFAYFDLYQIGDQVTGAVPVLFVLYLVLAIVLIPLLYLTYRRKQLK